MTSSIRSLTFNTWYGKLLVAVVIIAVILVLIGAIIGGILSLVLPVPDTGGDSAASGAADYDDFR